MHRARAGRIAALTTAAVLAPLVTTTAPVARAEDSAAAETTMQFITLIDRYLEQRADRVTVRPSLAGALAVPATEAMSQTLSTEYQQLRERGTEYEKLDGGYTRAQVTITPRGEVSQIGDVARLEVTEDTKLFHPFSPEEVAEGAPEAEEYSLDHTVTFKRGNDRIWRLSNDRAITGSMPPSTYMAEPETDLEIPEDDSGTPEEAEGGKDETSSPDGTSGPDGDPKAITASANYDYIKMVKYANKHWKNYSDDYRKYGNDCTNFISQAMIAGGWKTTSGSFSSRRSNKKWFYGTTKWTTSYTWAGAENWYFFAKKHSKRTKILRYVQDMTYGDVLQADFEPDKNINHTMIVTKQYRGNPYLTYHTPSVHNRSLKKILNKYPRAWWYAHRT